MIKDIQEYFGAEGQWATLHQATVSLVDMGDRTITTQVKIDGDHIPDFSGWELSFKGERFILPIREPQAAKDNSSLNSRVDLTFYSWPIYQLKRYYFVSLSTVAAGVEIADKYDTPINLNVEGFVSLFNRVLQYYFGNAIRMELYRSGSGIYSSEPSLVEIDHTYIWDVLQKFFDTFGVRWVIEYDSATNAYVIKAGFPPVEIGDHDFEYGFDGGLLRFERQVQDDNINNILLGRGGEKNLPYRYFKRTDPQNPDWAADPDAIPELANITFDRLRDINFRWYVRGWMTNENRDKSWENAGYVYPTYSDIPEQYAWAYNKGATDAKFNPVEYVKDDESIAKYGERWGALDDNDEIYPTIQGITREPYGRVDETVAVGEIITDDIEAAAESAAVESNVVGPRTVTHNFGPREVFDETLLGGEFSVPSGSTGTITTTLLNPRDNKAATVPEVVVSTIEITAENLATGEDEPIAGLPAGDYRLKIHLVAENQGTGGKNFVTYGLNTVKLVTSVADANAWKPTFDIWVKNIWGSTQESGESDAQYAARVWEPILGDRTGGEAKIVFSDGFMSASQDYEFALAAYPVKDRTKSINGVQSEWKITLYKSDAEFDATGLFIPNSKTGGKPTAGDHFYFIGIDMPFQYVLWAEENLNQYKTEQLEDIADIKPTWLIGLDKVRVHSLADDEYGQTLAERLVAGATVRITDPRFTNGNVLTLYAQSITYTWNEPSEGNPYIVPDIEVVLSDKVITSESPVERLSSDMSVIRSTYVRATDLEAAVRRVASPLFLKKTGESDASDSPTTFSSKVSSKDFRQGGIGGSGWGHYIDGESDSVLELDKLVVRKELQVNSLVANQISYEGGRHITSAASIECTQVVDTDAGYLCYFDQKQGSVANLFQVGDIAMGQMFDPENNEERYYRAVVTAVSDNSITLSKSQKDGEGIPEAGDTIVQYGSISDPTRQYVIIRDVIGGGYERMLSGLNAVNASGLEYYFAGKQVTQSGGQTVVGDRWFVGDINGEHAEWKNGVLNITGRISVRKGDGTYESMADYIDSLEYLTDALADGTTVVEGGLILTNLIQLGQTEGGVFKVYSGINGHLDQTLQDPTTSIAAWYGGEMLEKTAWDAMTPEQKAAHIYAKSLFRHDGSGYLASGNIGWDASGAGHIPGISWEGNSVIISGDVKLASLSGDSVTELLSLVRNLNNWFGEDENGDVYVKRDGTRNRNFYAFGQVAAGGLATDSGGGGGADLSRVWESLVNNTDFPDVEINLAHIPTIPYSHISGTPEIPTIIDRARNLLDGDDLCYVDPEEGEEITIDDPGTTGTVLWGAESANQVALSVNGTSKLLLKAASLDGINSSITTLLGYFSGGSARNALALENHSASYFATATGLSALDTRVTALEGGSFEPTEMWDLLGAATNEQINLSHIPDFTTAKITNLESWIASKAYITAAAIPTNVSAFNNDAGYLTTHQSLANYYTKAETDTEISDAIAALNLGTAAQRGVASTITASSTNLATSKAVYDYANAILSSAIKFQGVTTTALTDGATTNPIIIDGASYTANRGDEVIYGGKEFLYTGTKWQQLGDEESWALKTISITGEGYLTGGGTLAANRAIDLTSSAKEKVDNGATAYGWGNHANAGYFLASNFTKANIKTTLGISDWALANTKPSYAKGEVGLGDVDNLAASAYFTLLANDNNQISITVGGTNKKLTVDYASQAGNASTLEDHAADYFATAAALSGVSGRVTTLENRQNWDEIFGIDANGNVYVRDIDANTPRTFYNNGNISAGGLNSSGGGSSVDLARVWESLTNNTDFPDEKINIAHIPTIPYSNISGTPTIIDRARNLIDGDDLCYVDTEAGEEITIDDPGTTGTVLWGSESANQVSLSVNGVSKLLLKSAAVEGITSRLGILEGYFSGGVARNAALLNGHEESYFATAESVTAESIANSLTNAGYKLTDTIYTLPTASADTLGGIKIGNGLAINNGVVSVTGQTQGTVTRVDVGSTPYNPNTSGVVSLPAYPTTLPASDVSAWAKASSLAVDSVPSLPWSKITSGTPDTLAGYGITDAKFSSAGVSDKIRITLGSNYHDVLTAHQSLSGYATENWVGQQGFITKAVNDLTNYYLKSDTYTKAEVEALIAAINQFHYEIAASTSDVSDPQSNVLYLIGPTGSGSDRYEEYVYTTTWVKIGDTSIDLSGYVNSVVASGSGNYISGFSKSGNTLTLNMATLPTTIALLNVTDADDLKAIEALTGTSGLLRKSGANTWELDTSAYITGIDALMVNTALGYTPFNAAYFTKSNIKNTLGISDWALDSSLAFGSLPDMYIGNARVQSSAQTAQDLGGIQYLTAQRVYLGDGVYFYYDSNNGGVKLEGAGFYTDSFISGGGLNSNSGGGNIDLDRVWESLTNNTDKPNVEINVAHIPDITVDKVSNIENWILGKGYITSSAIPTNVSDFNNDAGYLTDYTIYALTIKNSVGTNVLNYNPKTAAGELSLSKAMIGLGNVENTALSTWQGSQNINTLGTVTTGVWHGTAIANEYLALDMSWALVRASATYDTEDYIHAN